MYRNTHTIVKYIRIQEKSSARHIILHFELLPGALTARLSTPGFYTGQGLEFSLVLFSSLFLWISALGEKEKAGSQRSHSGLLFKLSGWVTFESEEKGN